MRSPGSPPSRTGARGPRTASRATARALLLPLHQALTGDRGRRARDVLPARAVAARHRRGGLPRRGARAVRLARRPARRRRARLDRDGEHAAHRPARARAVRRAGRRAARAPRAPPGGAGRRRLRRVALVPDGDLQGALRRDAARELLPRPRRPAVGGARGRSSTSASRRTPSRAGSARSRSGFLCHNGEINTIEGNVAWMEARERARGLEAELAPALDRSGSDSALLDNALELLVRAGLDVREAVTLLVPPAWQNDPRDRRRGAGDAPLPRDARRAVGRARRARVHATASCAARRSTATACARCASPCATTASSPSSSEAGAIPLPEGVAVRRARLGPGQLLSLDPRARAALRRRAQARARARASRTPSWVDDERRASPSRASRSPRPRATSAPATRSTATRARSSA